MYIDPRYKKVLTPAQKVDAVSYLLELYRRKRELNNGNFYNYFSPFPVLFPRALAKFFCRFIFTCFYNSLVLVGAYLNDLYVNLLQFFLKNK